VRFFKFLYKKNKIEIIFIEIIIFNFVMHTIINQEFIDYIISKSVIHNNNNYSTFNHIAFMTTKKVKHKKGVY
jgi:hypothetical protein